MKLKFLVLLNFVLCMVHLFAQPLQTNVNYEFLYKQALNQNGYGCAFGDFTNDGYLDVYIAYGNISADSLWINDGTGKFVNSGQGIGTIGKRNTSIALGDLNGDGYLDVFIANDCSQTVSEYKVGYPNEVWFNDGKGKLIDSGQRLGKNPSVSVSLGDIDNDGDLDAAVANLHTFEGISKPNKLWVNNRGVFTEVNIEMGERCHYSKIVDVNNDSLLDVFFDGNLWINKGNLSFTKRTQCFSSEHLIFSDIDNDNDVDALAIIGGHPGAKGASQVWINDGEGNFTDSGMRLGNSISNSAVFGDFDNDGDLDIYVANGCFPLPEPDKIWINMGGIQNDTLGTFEDSGIKFPSTRSWEAILGDVNNDSLLDIFVTNGWGRKNENNQLYINHKSTASISKKKVKLKVL